VGRDSVARAFYDLYRTQSQEFPPEAKEADYEKRLKAAYPIHPEVFDRLYSDWSSLVKFQRTRGVLRLMAAVIHSLWEKGDRNPLIMPSNIPIDDPQVQFELTRYLSDNWVPIIERDVDGPNALPIQIDSQVTNLGRYAACRRVARTIYLGSAPTTAAANIGLEDRRVKLGCVMPGESSALFGDALRRLTSKATYLYEDGNRYWYSTQPTVTKLAEDRKENFRREPDVVEEEINKRLRHDLRNSGDFDRIHPLPDSGQEVPDDFETRLVVLRIDYPYGREPGSPAEVEAKGIQESRGNAPRIYRNTLVFMAADKTRLSELYDAACYYLAWDSILKEKEELDLSPFQVRQAENQMSTADNTVNARIPETYQWLIVPDQKSPQAGVEWEAYRLSGQGALAERVSKKLRNDELLVTGFAATRLRMELDRVPLWRGDHVAIKQLVEDFARYLYLPRLKNSSVLLEAIRDGLASENWVRETFAYAESYDEDAGRYLGLKHGKQVNIVYDSYNQGLLVKPDIARGQIDAEAQESGVGAETGVGTVSPGEGEEGASGGGTVATGEGQEEEPGAPRLKRFHGSVEIDAERVGRDAGKIAEEVITHLTGLVNSKVKVTLEIEAEIPDGAPEHVVRAVTENSRTLRFTNHGFEEE